MEASSAGRRFGGPHRRDALTIGVFACSIAAGSASNAQTTTPPPSLAPAATTPTQQIEPLGNSTSSGFGVQSVPARQYFRIPGEDPGFLFNLATLGAPVGQTLSRDGVYFHGSLQDVINDDIRGGNKIGTIGSGFSEAGIDLDTEKAFGLRGGLIDFSVDGQFGNAHDGYNNIGSVIGNPYALGQLFGMQSLYYDQQLFGRVMDVAFGRMSNVKSIPSIVPDQVSPGFDSAPWYCTFFTTSCADPGSYSYGPAKNSIYYGSWASVITFHPVRHWYLKAGVFEAEPGQGRIAGLNDFPNRSWGLNYANGAYLPVQLGYSTSAATSAYPTFLELGGYYDTSEYADKYLKVDHDQASGLFWNVQQTVLKFSSNSRSQRGLALFTGGNEDLSSLLTFRSQYSIGAIATGVFPSRAADTINLLVYTALFDPRYAEARAAVARAHHSNYHAQQETGLELNYGVALAPGVSVSPYVQYIINPDQVGLPVPNPRDRYAVAIGVKALIRLQDVLGLPEPGR